MKSRYKKILIGALGIVHNSSGEVLVVKQKSGPYSGAWLFPGGGIEMSEDPEETVVREVYEETSISEAEVDRCLGAYQLKGMFGDQPYHLIMFVYVLKSDQSIDGNFAFDNVEEARWVNPKQFPIHSTDKKFLVDAGLHNVDEQEVANELARDCIDMTKITP